MGGILWRTPMLGYEVIQSILGKVEAESRGTDIDTAEVMDIDVRSTCGKGVAGIVCFDQSRIF